MVIIIYPNRLERFLFINYKDINMNESIGKKILSIFSEFKLCICEGLGTVKMALVSKVL